MDKQRTVLITGLTSEIGKETALCFAGRGWNVVGHYHEQEKSAREVKAAIEESGVLCRLLQADFLSGESLGIFLKALGNTKIDSLINNAGTYLVSKEFSELDYDDLQKTFTVNVFAPIKISAALFGPMRKEKFGRIVNISSIAAKYGGSARSLHYGSAKRALEGLTRTLAREGASDNVLVNTIRPGVIDTDFHKKFPKDMEKRIAMIPMKKMGDPADIAEMAFYLGSDKNGYITGETVTVAGGE